MLCHARAVLAVRFDISVKARYPEQTPPGSRREPRPEVQADMAVHLAPSCFPLVSGLIDNQKLPKSSNKSTHRVAPGKLCFTPNQPHPSIHPTATCPSPSPRPPSSHAPHPHTCSSSFSQPRHQTSPPPYSPSSFPSPHSPSAAAP